MYICLVHDRYRVDRQWSENCPSPPLTRASVLPRSLSYIQAAGLLL